jgi:S1-C subfamily serine protease
MGGTMQMRNWSPYSAAVLQLWLTTLPAFAGAYEDAVLAARNKDYESARSQYQSCALDGDERCQNNLGLLLLHGLGGSADNALAVRYFAAAAAKGQVNAITSLADCYEKGNGVPVNLENAVSLYTAAAKRGFHVAHESLGSLYERGLGLPRNDVYAAMHYVLATQKVAGGNNSYYRQEFDKAKSSLDRLMVALSEEQRDRVQELARNWPNLPMPSTEVARGTGFSSTASPQLPNAALVSKLSAATILVIGRTKKGIVTGSAFWIAPGLAITNKHVVEDVTDPEVLLLRPGSSEPLKGSIIAATTNSEIGLLDLAVIRSARLEGLVVLPLTAATSPLTDVVAAGYPGFSTDLDKAFWRRLSSNNWTAPSIVITSGQISSIQNPQGRAEVLMHTAQIWSGSSGGPLIDRCGRVVGINPVRFSDAKKQEGANYALSASALMIFLRDKGVPFESMARNC